MTTATDVASPAPQDLALAGGEVHPVAVAGVDVLDGAVLGEGGGGGERQNERGGEESLEHGVNSCWGGDRLSDALRVRRNRPDPRG